MNSGMFFSSLKTGTTRLRSIGVATIFAGKSLEVDVHYAVGTLAGVVRAKLKRLIRGEIRLCLGGRRQRDCDSLRSLETQHSRRAHLVVHIDAQREIRL